MAKYLFNCTSFPEDYSAGNGTDAITDYITTNDDQVFTPYFESGFNCTASFTSQQNISTSGTVTLNIRYQKPNNTNLYLQINGSNIYQFATTHNEDDMATYLTDVKIDVTQYVTNGQTFSFDIYAEHPDDDYWYIYSLDYIELETDSSGGESGGSDDGGGGSSSEPKTITLIPTDASGSSWSNVSNTYDGDTSTSGTVSITSSTYSSRVLTLNFDTSEIPSGSTINSAILTVVAKHSSSNSSRRVTVQVDINGNSDNRVIEEQLTSTSQTELTADVSNYISSLSTLDITPYVSTTRSGTFTLYEVYIDVEYVEPSSGGGEDDPETGGGDNPETGGGDDPNDDIGGNVPFDGTIVIYTVNSSAVGTIPSTNLAINKSVVDNGNGTSTVTITGTEAPEWLSFSDIGGDLIEIHRLYTNNMTILAQAFTGCTNLISLNSSKWYGPNITSFYQAFDNCASLPTIDLSNLRPVSNSDEYDFEGAFAMCYSLKELNLSNFNYIDNNTGLPFVNSDTFLDCYLLDKIYAYNTNFSILNELINYLPDRNIVYNEWPGTGQSGTIYVSSTQNIDVDRAAELNWNVSTELIPGKDGNVVENTEIKILEYKFDNTIANLLPSFNAGFDYTYTDVVENNVTTRTINAYSLPTEIRFGTNVGEPSEADLVAPSSLLEILYLNTENLTTLNDFARRCSNLTYVNTEGWKLDKVTSCIAIFEECKSLTTLDVSGWDTSNVINMSYMFYGCSNLTALNVSDWNTENVTDMRAMFHDCISLPTLDVSNWDTSNVTDMGWLFFNCYTLSTLNLNSWDTSKVTITQSMFHNCQSLTSLDISNFNTNNVTNMDSMFYNCENLVSLDISNFDTSNVKNMHTMFYDCQSLTSLDVSNFNTSQVTDMQSMFYGCSSLTTLDLSGWNTTNVTTIETMFAYCSNLLTVTGLNDLDVSNVNNMGGLFSDCSNITEINVSDWDVSKVTNFGAVFRRCPKLAIIDVSKWNTSSGVIMSGIFTNDSSLIELDLSNWDMSHANSVNQMFYGCSALMKLKMCANLNQDANTTYWFSKCNSLIDVQLSDFDTYTINKVIDELPAKTANNQGSLIVPKIDDSINTSTADSKYWIIASDSTNIRHMHLGDIVISNLYIGEIEIKKVYLGEIIVYENKQAATDKDILYNEFTGTLFILKEDALSYDEEELTLNINSDIIDVSHNEENLDIGGDK